jgi:hypothetical protein
MRAFSIVIALLLSSLSCAGPPPMKAVRTPGAERIPLSIVLHPLLSTQSESGWGTSAALMSQDRGSLYITPPAKTTMQVTGTSERLTNLLTVELAQRGFKLRELPVEAPVEGQSAFAVSLALLDDLREHNDVHAILIGNAFFARPYNRFDDSQVTDLYLKVVNTETLEVMCQITIGHDASGWSMPAVASEVADELADNAGLAAVPK